MRAHAAAAAAAAALCWTLGTLPACGGKRQPEARPAPRSTDGTTGAVASLPESTLAERHAESVEELLQGRIPGLQVVHLANGDVSLRIRGGSVSLRGASDVGEPLLVIDGMPVAPRHLARALRSLNPREIDTIEILKDVSSTSSYGMAGAHGVILITTKRD